MRKNLILIHLLLASFVAPAFLLLATSGGLYLFGIKGSVQSEAIALPGDANLDFSAPDLAQSVRQFLTANQINHDFEYIKNRGSLLQTRPTSRTYLEFKQSENGLSLTRQTPDLQKSMIELHKGHGPSNFKTYQKLVAFALLVSVITGLWMGLASPAWRRKTLVASAAGLLLFVVLALT